MLHQYSNQQFADLRNHYSSSLTNCSSYLLNQSCSEQASKVNDLCDCSIDDNVFLNKDADCVDEYRNHLQTTSSFDTKSCLTMAKDTEQQSSNCCKTFEEVESKEKFDDANHQLIKDEQDNNIHDGSQKIQSCQEKDKIVPNTNNAPTEIKSTGELKDGTNVMSSDINELYDENESNFRLPGFHQAFGSTEIGRFVHQKDFIEHINQQTSFISPKPSSIPPIPCSSSSISNSIINTSNAKIRSRYNKRLKVPAHALPPPPPSAPPTPTDLTRSSSWNYEYDSSSTVCSPLNFQSNNNANNYYAKYRDTRSKRNQYSESNLTSAYCSSDDYCNSSYYYDGGCSDNVNCDYYRYQQNSSYYHNGYSTYSNLHTGYSNGYHYAKDHNDRYGTTMSGDMGCSLNQNCEVDKYYSSYNEEPLPYHYDKQSSNSPSYHQYQPYMSHSQHQFPSQQLYNNYNNYNSYTPISSFNYY